MNDENRATDGTNAAGNQPGGGPPGPAGRSALARHRNGAIAAVAAATLWTVLAWRTPGSTHHFAPLVAAGVWGYLTRHDGMPNPSRRHRSVMLVGGFAVPIAAQLVLTLNDKLQGPPLFSAIPVQTELVVMAALGAVIGSGAWRLVATDQPAPESTS